MNLNKQLTQYNVLAMLDCGLLTAKEATRELRVSKRHVKRLLRKFRKLGKNFRSAVGTIRAAANRVPERTEKAVVSFKRENPKRSNKRIAELVELECEETISANTVRNILVRHDCYEKTETERRVYTKLEDRIVQSGQMLQMDTCEGSWLSGYRRVNLIAIMDAYSRYIVAWRWVEADSAWNNIAVLRVSIEKYGVPEILYTDNASFFKVIRHNRSIHQKHKSEDEYETTIQRIMLELCSTLVTHKPHEPQGKGRIERFFRFMQDRFIREHTATTLEELNQQFRKWVKWYHEKHVIRTIGCAPKDRFSSEGFKPVPENLNLDQVFSFQYTRKIDKYNSFSFEGHRYTIDMEIDCFVAFTIQLCVTDTTIFVYWQGHFVQKFKRISKNNV